MLGSTMSPEQAGSPCSFLISQHQSLNHLLIFITSQMSCSFCQNWKNSVEDLHFLDCLPYLSVDFWAPHSAINCYFSSYTRLSVSEFVCSALVLEPHSCSWYWHLLRLFFLLVAFYKNTSWTEKILQIYPDYLRKVTKKKKVLNVLFLERCHTWVLAHSFSSTAEEFTMAIKYYIWLPCIKAEQRSDCHLQAADLQQWPNIPITLCVCSLEDECTV